jgi:hypothetical protein
VVTISSKVTATEVAAAQEEEVLVETLVVDVVDPDPVSVVVVVLPVPPETGVWFAGQDPVEAVEYVPIAEVAEQTDGTLDAAGSPQE